MAAAVENGRPAAHPEPWSSIMWALSRRLQAGAAQSQGHGRAVPSLQYTGQPMVLAWEGDTGQSVGLF